MVGRQRLQLVHGARPSGKVHRQNGLGTLGERRAHSCGIDVHGLGIHVGEHRSGAGVDHRVHGGRERERRGHDLVPRPQAQGKHREVQGGRAGTDGDGVLDALVGGEVTLEARHLGPAAQPAAAHGGDDLGDLLLAHGRGSEHEEAIWRADRRVGHRGVDLAFDEEGSRRSRV